MPAKNSAKANNFRTWVLVLPSLLALMIAGIFYWKWQGARQDPKKFLEQQSKREIEAVVAKVGKLLVLPQDEMPTVLTIENRDDLDTSQEFLSLAENGDKLLLYQDSKKAILYRPRTNQIVNVAPINVAPEKTAAAEASPSGEIAP
jgi:hypothetical protein